MTDLLTRKDLAAALNVSLSTIARWRRAKMPAAVDRGGVVRFDAAEVLTWFEVQRDNPKTAVAVAAPIVRRVGRPRNVDRADHGSGRLASANGTETGRNRTVDPSVELDRLIGAMKRRLERKAQPDKLDLAEMADLERLELEASAQVVAPMAVARGQQASTPSMPRSKATKRRAMGVRQI